jgi:hypothetical protein
MATGYRENRIPKDADQALVDRWFAAVDSADAALQASLAIDIDDPAWEAADAAYMAARNEMRKAWTALTGESDYRSGDVC